MQLPQLYYFAADEYGCGAYGSSSYNQCGTTIGGGSAGTGSSTSSGSGGVSGTLANTGYGVLVPLALAVAVAGAAAILLVKRLRRRGQSAIEDQQ